MVCRFVAKKEKRPIVMNVMAKENVQMEAVVRARLFKVVVLSQMPVVEKMKFIIQPLEHANVKKTIIVQMVSAPIVREELFTI